VHIAHEYFEVNLAVDQLLKFIWKHLLIKIVYYISMNYSFMSFYTDSRTS